MNQTETKSFFILAFIGVTLSLLSLLMNTDSISVEINAAGRNSSDSMAAIGRELDLFIESISNLSNLSLENQQLRIEVQDLKVELDMYKEFDEINEFMDKYNADVGEVARVISPSTTMSEGYVFIDKGMGAGIDSGDLIVINRYLVGIVDVVSSNYSSVKLVTNNDSNLPVNVGGYNGIARGVANISVRVYEVDELIDASIGTDIQILPTNSIPTLGEYSLGNLREIVRGSGGWVEFIEIDYPIVISDLEYVKVVKNE